MYKITRTDGSILGLTELPLYIKISNNGSFIPADNIKAATGIAYQGNVYSLVGKTEIDAESVIVSNLDAGEKLVEQDTTITTNKNDAEEAFCELDEIVLTLKEKVAILEQRVAFLESGVQ